MCSLGFASDRLPPKTFQGTPMRHRGVHVGNFYLVEKERAEAFTDEDEEILVLFASQAPTAIANARTYRAEQRARADLKALIETSPVGVVVFDFGTGRPVSLNREARRIVEGLRMPGRTAEDLLVILTCRFADGREIALGEFPLAGVLSGAETVRAEEIVLITPTGAASPRWSTQRRSTPRTAPSRRWWSPYFDLAPLQALERMRAEFLGMVSHELRVPLTSIKGSTAAVLGGARHFAPAETREFFRIVDEQADRMIGLIADLLDAGRIDTGTLSASPEPTEVALLVDRVRRATRDLGEQRQRPLQGERVGRDVLRHRRTGPPVRDEGPVMAGLQPHRRTVVRRRAELAQPRLGPFSRLSRFSRSASSATARKLSDYADIPRPAASSCNGSGRRLGIIRTAAFLRATSGVSLGYVPSVTRFDRPKARVRTTKTFFSEG